jgi:iron(III) transport system permease protein
LSAADPIAPSPRSAFSFRGTGNAAETIVAGLVFGLTLLLILAPVGFIFYGSFQAAAPGAPDGGFTLGNWAEAYTSQTYLVALGNTVALAVTVAVLSIALGGMLAWIITRTDAPWGAQLALLLLVPLMISNLVTTLAWIALAAPNAGFINAYVRGWTGIRTIFNIYSFSGIVLVHVLHYTSFAFLAFFAALRSIDSSLEEASYILGAGPWRTSLRMTLPLISPTIATTFLVIFVFVCENFSVPTLLGTPIGFQTLPSLIYFNMEVTPSRPTLAAAAGTMLLWVAVLGTVWQRHIASRAGRYVTVGGKGSQPRVTRLGKWRYVATGFVVFYIFLAVGLPYAALILGSFLKFLTANLRPSAFTLDNYLVLFDSDNFTPVRNSLLFGAGGGLLMTFVYLLISYLMMRTRNRFGALVDYITIIPTAIPALILGVGLIWTFVGLPIPIYGTAAILMIAYFIRYIGYGVRHSTNAINQVSGDLTEAARISGASPLRALRDILIPIIQPSILSLWTVLFIFIFMEVSATILLYSPSTRTLPTMLWTQMGSGSQTRAFAIAVVQATIIFVVLIVADRKFGTLKSTLKG